MPPMTTRPGNPILRRLRAELGLTQRELAKKIRVHHIYVSQLENGYFRLGWQVGSRIWDRYGAILRRRGVTFELLMNSGKRRVVAKGHRRKRAASR